MSSASQLRRAISGETNKDKIAFQAKARVRANVILAKEKAKVEARRIRRQEKGDSNGL